MRANPYRFWLSSAARLLILTALVLALAGVQIRLNSNLVTTVFVLDASDSLTPEQRAQGERFIQDAVVNMNTNQKAAIVVFGEEAMVDRLPSDSAPARDCFDPDRQPHQHRRRASTCTGDPPRRGFAKNCAFI
ncbi:MAG: hypothetical protein M5U05_15335 [Anaerolineales bacterium]|nr:hypothetical protein [Anaerolineales bacterium]